MNHRLPLIGGSYSARSILANCQKCINLYPEANRQDAPVPITHYQRPGLRPLTQLGFEGQGGSVVRGLYVTSNGVNLVVYNNINGDGTISVVLARINADWSHAPIGTLAQVRSNPVSIIDNRNQAMIVDGSISQSNAEGELTLAAGYTYNLESGAFAQINDPTGTFIGAIKVDYIDTFIIWPIFAASGDATNQWASTNSNEIEPFNDTYIATKTAYPDDLITIIVNNHEIIMLGRKKSEVWYDAGGILFPFAELPGAYIEHGCVAPYSAASADISIFWLAQDLQGQGMVFRRRGYQTSRISNHGLEYQLRQLWANGISIADAIGFTYQFDGHVFYHLTFPQGDQTWVFDDSISDPNLAWHQEGWTDAKGILHRHRANCFAYMNGTLVVGDFENGTLYAMDPNVYTDTVPFGGTALPFSCTRTFPHLMMGLNSQGQPQPADGLIVQHEAFQADIEPGLADFSQSEAGNRQLSLRWSDDRGRTWSNPVLLSMGDLGKYDTRPFQKNLGQAMDRVYELSYAIGAQATLNGAWVSGKVLSK